MKLGKFIIVEGIDGAGKSTVTEWIAENYNFHFHKTPNGPFAEASHLFNADRVRPQERFSFYCGENIRASQFVSEQVKKGVNVIVDRYYLSTISYHKSLYPDIYENYKEIFKVLYPPDLTLIVMTDFDKIKARLTAREWQPNDKFYLTAEYFGKIYGNLNDAVQYLNLQHHIIDNNSSFQETKIAISKIINSIDF